MMPAAFVAWMSRVDRALKVLSGLASDDIAEFDYWTPWCNGADPRDVAREALAHHDDDEVDR